MYIKTDCVIKSNLSQKIIKINLLQDSLTIHATRLQMPLTFL